MKMREIMNLMENADQGLPEGTEVVFQPPPTDPPLGRSWGGANPPPVGTTMIVTHCRMKDGKPFWYEVRSQGGTNWRVWPDQIQPI